MKMLLPPAREIVVLHSQLVKAAKRQFGSMMIFPDYLHNDYSGIARNSPSFRVHLRARSFAQQREYLFMVLFRGDRYFLVSIKGENGKQVERNVENLPPGSTSKEIYVRIREIYFTWMKEYASEMLLS